MPTARAVFEGKKKKKILGAPGQAGVKLRVRESSSSGFEVLSQKGAALLARTMHGHHRQRVLNLYRSLLRSGRSYPVRAANTRCCLFIRPTH
jgi:hypothetical protein